MNIYPKGKQKLLNGTTDWITADIRVALLEGATYQATDEFLSDLEAGSVVAKAAASLTGKAVNVSGANVELAGDDITIAAVPTGHTIDGVAIYVHNASDSAAALIAFIDVQQDGSTAISLPTNGSDVLVDLVNAGLLEF